VFTRKPKRKKLHLNSYKTKSRHRTTEWKRGIFRKKRTLAAPKIALATPRFRARESSGNLQRKVALFLSLLASGSLFYLLFFFPFWQVKKIAVTGNNYVNSQEVEKLAFEYLQGRFFIFPKKNLIIAPAKTIAAAIYNQFSQISQVKIKKEFPDVLKIEIEENKPQAIWASGAPADLFLPAEAFAADTTSEKTVDEAQQDEPAPLVAVVPSYPENQTILYYFLNENGEIGADILPEKVFEQNLPILYDQSFKKAEGREKILDPEFLNFLFQLEDLLPLKSDLKIQEFIVPIAYSADLYIKTNKGFQIFFDTKQSLVQQIEALVLILKEDIEKNGKEVQYYIDLRVQGMVYYK